MTFYHPSGSDFDRCSVFTSFLLPATASVVLCSPAHLDVSSPGTKPAASEMTCLVNPGRMEPPGNMLLSDCPPVLHMLRVKQFESCFFFLKKCPSPQFQPSSWLFFPPCPTCQGLSLSGDGWLQPVKKHWPLSQAAHLMCSDLKSSIQSPQKVLIKCFVNL